MDTVRILEEVKKGTLTVEEAKALLCQDSFEEMGYAKLDTDRKARTGFAEVVFCSGKADSHLLQIYGRIYQKEGEVLGTRASAEQYRLVKEEFPKVQYDPISRI